MNIEPRFFISATLILITCVLPLCETMVRADEAMFGPVIQLTDDEASAIGQHVWLNETGGKMENLIVWNKGEMFVSLGIGHFIWYPQHYDGPFQESFPDLLKWLKTSAIPFPDWLNETTDCPWMTRDEFQQHQHSRQMADLQALLRSTVPQQTRFLVRRLELALPKMLESVATDERRRYIREQFARVAGSPEGLYALIDYVNFKGEGTSLTERYSGQGWGLFQVLEQMEQDARIPVHAFADAAEHILTRRVHNAPPDRHESRWLPGWKNRIQTYRQF